MIPWKIIYDKVKQKILNQRILYIDVNFHFIFLTSQLTSLSLSTLKNVMISTTRATTITMQINSN